MLTITLTPELELAVMERARQQGTTPELLTLDVLQERFLGPPAATSLPGDASLADALVDYIGAIDTSRKYPQGSKLSESGGPEFAQLMVEKHRLGKL